MEKHLFKIEVNMPVIIFFGQFYNYLIWSQGFFPSHVVCILPLSLDLLQHTLQECRVIVNDAQEPWVILLPPSNVAEKFIKGEHIIFIDISISSGIKTFKEIAQFLDLKRRQETAVLRDIHRFIRELANSSPSSPTGFTHSCTHFS